MDQEVKIPIEELVQLKEFDGHERLHSEFIDTIAGYDIPVKTQVFTNVWAIGRDPKHWDDHLEFRPERFLSDDHESGKMGQVGVRGQHYQLFPFGSGRRGCP
ncbi:hypothetical protein JHK82_040016 [Glycine max]|nr:hypothetical protein JHK86_040214 [Glycine max]KAG4965823.1 hypothetical protein JHK85_040798 [Glycine max]KAG5110793.1 hypothetical protein JHK82_040016 [Glycine max]KAG5122089.1 hypothetical protein JHK84_040429 [Glycine max]